MFYTKNIQPFNEVFFYNCTHSCLFSILDTNGGDYREFLASSILYFSVRRDEKGSWFLTRVNFVKNHEDIINSQGFSIEKKDYDDNIIDYLYGKIHDNCPVIVSVDCYELDYREDLYKIDYWPHSILVYDYEEEKQMFKVIDQPNRNEIVFDCYNISKFQLKKAIELYWKNTQNNENYNSDTAISFINNAFYRKRENRAIFDEWIMNRKSNESLIMDGISNVESIIPDMILTLKNVEKDIENIGIDNNLLSGLNDIVKQKKWEQSFIADISEGRGKYSIINKIYDEWVNVRKYAGLIILSGRIRKKSLMNFEEKIKHVLQLERNLQSIVRNEGE